VYINLSLATKIARANAINTAIGVSGWLLLYSVEPPTAGVTVLPLTPDYPPPAGSALLAQLALAPIAAVTVITIQSMVVNYPGSGGVDGAQLISGTTGIGTLFQASGTILNGALVSIDAIPVPGAYTTAPTDITDEPVNGGGLVGATVSLVATAALVFNPIAQAAGLVTGTVGFGRLASAASITSGAMTGVIDLDAGVIGTNPLAALTLNASTIYLDVPIIISSDILTEA
jgi:hypothetical protein